MRRSQSSRIICRSLKAGFSLGSCGFNLKCYFTYQYLVNGLTPSLQGTWSSFTRGAIRRTEIVSPLVQYSIPQYSNEMEKKRRFLLLHWKQTYRPPEHKPLEHKNGGKSKGMRGSREGSQKWTCSVSVVTLINIPSDQGNIPFDQANGTENISWIKATTFSSGLMIIRTRESTDCSSFCCISE